MKLIECSLNQFNVAIPEANKGHLGVNCGEIVACANYSANFPTLENDLHFFLTNLLLRQSKGLFQCLGYSGPELISVFHADGKCCEIRPPAEGWQSG